MDSSVKRFLLRLGKNTTIRKNVKAEIFLCVCVNAEELCHGFLASSQKRCVHLDGVGRFAFPNTK
jgi:hypothetical protein